MISYYELLGMIKEGKAPNKIRVHLNSQPRIYEAEYDGGDFNYYELVNLKENDDEYYRYLMDSFIESMMFGKTIEILDKKEIPEKIEEKKIKISMSIGEKVCVNKINEIIDYLNSKGE